MKDIMNLQVISEITHPSFNFTNPWSFSICNMSEKEARSVGKFPAIIGKVSSEESAWGDSSTMVDKTAEAWGSLLN